MRSVLGALACGLVFGFGLTVSRMIDPAKVKGFLDVAGSWDPSLALVMGSALAVTTVAFARAAAAVKQGRRPLLASSFELPSARGTDAPLLAGAVLFGVGWGLAGLCPGPAISALATGRWEVVLFVVSMIAGMWGYGVVESRRSSSTAASTHYMRS